MTHYLIYAGVFILLLAFKLWWDSRAKNNGRIINHLRSSTIDVVIYTTSAFLLFYYKGDYNLIGVLGFVLLAITWRWKLFDPIFAKIHWGVWDKHGDSSKIDVFLAALRDGTPIKVGKKKITIKMGKWHVLVKFIPEIVSLGLIWIGI